MKLFRERTMGFTMVELLVVIGLIVLVIAFLLPSVSHTHGGSNRIKCAVNLKQIGSALLLYSNENRNAYPRTYATTDDRVDLTTTGVGAGNPFATTEGAPSPVGVNNVPAALFLLLRTQDIGSEVFTCPSANTEKDNFGGGTNTALNRSNFTDIGKNLSYSYANPYPSADAIKGGYKLTNALSPEFAVAADINPGIRDRDDDITVVTTTSSDAEMKRGNSNNHDGDGENVLFGDGHVEFVQNPFVGINRDNIYGPASGTRATPNYFKIPPTATTFGYRAANTAVAGLQPLDGNDSVLLPSDDAN